MSTAALESQLELLEEEALAVRDTLRQLVHRSGAAANIENQERLSVLAQLQKESQRIRTTLEKLRAQDPTPCQELSRRICPTADLVSSASHTDEIASCELSLWDERFQDSRDIVASMKSESTIELRTLEAEQLRAERFQAVSLLAPPIPTLPGSGSTTNLSLQSCVEELARAMIELNITSIDEAAVDVEPAATRALRTLDKQLQLQVDCRRLEPKTFENESNTTVVSCPATSGVVVDPTTRLAGTIREVAFCRLKGERPLRLLPHPIPQWSESEARRSTFMKEIATQNACEGFQGFVKAQTSKLALLRSVCGVECEVVPEATYALGCLDPTQRFSIHPIAGSIDHESRLDRRTMFWLMSRASRKRSGLEYEDGPMHYIYSGLDRSVRLHGFHVMKKPMTIGQLFKLLQDRRFADALEQVVPPMYRRRHYKTSFLPLCLNRDFNGFKGIEVRRPVAPNSSPDDDARCDDDFLEVPYFVAEAIANIFGGVVCPFDVWEAGGRGLEDPRDPRRSFLFSDAAASTSLKVRRKAWCIPVDEEEASTVPRSVFGECVRLCDGSPTEYLAKMKTPFRLEGYGRLGAEWNSTFSVGKQDESEKRAARGAVPEWLHTTTPASLSILQDSADDDVDGGLTPLTLSMSFAAPERDVCPASRWAPESVDYVPPTHVMRSLADLGSQSILAGTTSSELFDGRSFEEDQTFDPENEYSFVGLALYTFGLPSRALAGPVAAFRIAFPCTEEGRDVLAAAVERQDTFCGRNLTFGELVDGLGRQRKHVRAFRNLFFSEQYVEPLYRTTTARFPAAGFDVVFSAETPNPVCCIVLYGVHLLQLPQVIEHRSFQYPIGTDNVIPVTVPVEEKDFAQVMDWVKASSSVVLLVDNELEFKYRDTITLPPPPGRHALLGPTVMAVSVTWTWSTVITETLETVRVVSRCTVEQSTTNDIL